MFLHKSPQIQLMQVMFLRYVFYYENSSRPSINFHKDENNMNLQMYSVYARVFLNEDALKITFQETC